MRKKIALLLRGLTFQQGYRHHSGSYYDIDYRNNLSNTHAFIKQLQSNYDVDLFIATYESSLPNQQFIEDFPQCKDIIFLTPADNKQVDCVLAGLSLIHDHERYDLIIISRFDLIVKVHVDHLDIDWNKFNFIWKENTSENEEVGDCMIFFNSKYLQAFQMALNDCQQKNSLHSIKAHLDSYLDESDYHFIFKEKFNSNSDKIANPLYIIQRQDSRITQSFASKFLGSSSLKFKGFKI